MHTIALLSIIITSVVILIQDFWRRLIHVAYILLLGLSFVIYRISDPRYLLTVFVINFTFLVVLFAVLYGFFIVRTGNRKLIDRQIGLGDILIFVVLCLAYTLYNFVLFILISCGISLIYWIVKFLVSKEKNIKIPLAGFMMVSNLIVTLVCTYYTFDPFKQTVLTLL